MKTKQVVTGLALAAVMVACGPSAEEKAGVEKMKQDSIASLAGTSSAAVEDKKDTTHRFIRTAEMKFKVKSVIKSTYNIEEITARQGGFVTFTNLTSTINNLNNAAISADSSLETTFFTVSNSITLRVPNTNLDSILKEISRNIDYLDYRIIKAEDVALQLLSNKLAQNRAIKGEARLATAIDKHGKKLHETTAAEESLSNKQEQADNAKISNLSLKDQINFSTINLNIYQRQTIKRELIANNKNIEEYTPGFGSRILESLKYGWESFESVILFVAKLWGLVLIALIVFILYKLINRQLRKQE